MDDLEKIRLLLPHWIEHNRDHAREFAKWAAAVREQGRGEAADRLDRAIAALSEAETALGEALDLLGGPTAGNHSHQH